MRVIGIDPDTKGAVAFLDFDKLVGEAHHLPTEELYVKSKGTTRDRLADGPLADMWLEIATNPKIRPDFVFVEQALAFQKDSPASCLVNGITSGKLLMGATMAVKIKGLDTEIEIIPPLEWKGGFGLIFPELDYRQKKVKAVEFATEMFPNLAHHWDLVKHTSLAEATLIALYGALKHQAKLPKGLKHPTHAFKSPLNPLIQCLI